MANNIKLSNLSSKSLQQHQLKNFLGCDFYNDPLNVSKHRTPKMKNFIFENGVSRKRNGFIQRALITDIDNNPAKINGYWEFEDSFRIKHTLIHAGNRIYKYNYGVDLFHDTYTDITESTTYYPSYSTLQNWRAFVSDNIKNEKSYAIARKNRLYILTGGVYLVYGFWNYIELPEQEYEQLEAINENYLYYLTDTKQYYFQNNNIEKEDAAMCLNWELRPVQDNEDTYIPTTSIGIHPTLGVQTVLDEVNLLSRYRYNKLIGDNFVENPLGTIDFNKFKIPNSYFENSAVFSNYYFGYKIEDFTANNLQSFSIELRHRGEYIGTISSNLNRRIYEAWGTASSQSNNWEGIYDYFSNELNQSVFISDYFDDIILDISYEKNILNFKVYFDGLYEGITANIKFVSTVFYQLDANSIDENGLQVKINGELAQLWTDYTIDVENGRIRFFNDTTPLIEGESNIEVLFAPLNDNFQEKADYINKCKFGTTFGYNEAQYFFVSGNKDYPNYDWHTIDKSYSTNNIISRYEDLSYFGDLSYAVIGGNNSKIVGYSMLGDNSLAIIKEEYPNESSLYIRNSYLDNVVNASGDLVYKNDGSIYQKVYFSQFETSNKRGCVSNRTIQTLGKDKILLTKDGIYGITQTANIKSGERILRERSRLVNNKLIKEENLENAVAIVFDNRYYLAINNHIYIADSRFMTVESEEVDDTYSYEYWLWDISNHKDSKITTFFIKDNQLWFGTDKGDICGFTDKNNYIDKMFDKLHITLNQTDKGTALIYDETLYSVEDFKNSKIAIFDNGNNKYVYEFLTNISLNDTLTYSTDIDTMSFKLRYYGEKILYYLNDNLLTQCYIKDINISDNTYKLTDLSNNELNDLSSQLYDKLIGLYSATIDDEDNNLYLYNASLNGYKELLLDDFLSQVEFKVLLYREKNVEAYWYTAVLNLGNSSIMKTINYITVLPVVIGNGQVKIGYTTRKFNDTQDIVQGVDLYNINDFDTNYFSLDANDFNRVYTHKKKIRNFVLIQFVYLSNSPKECAINEIVLTYYLTKHNKGVN